jgi:hypothetical protein
MSEWPEARKIQRIVREGDLKKVVRREGRSAKSFSILAIEGGLIVAGRNSGEHG